MSDAMMLATLVILSLTVLGGVAALAYHAGHCAGRADALNILDESLCRRPIGSHTKLEFRRRVIDGRIWSR